MFALKFFNFQSCLVIILSESWPSGYSVRATNFGIQSVVCSARDLWTILTICITNYLSACSFTQFISSSHRSWAYGDGKSKVKPLTLFKTKLNSYKSYKQSLSRQYEESVVIKTYSKQTVTRYEHNQLVYSAVTKLYFAGYKRHCSFSSQSVNQTVYTKTSSIRPVCDNSRCPFSITV